MTVRPQYRVGISGWKYPGWRGKFYPEGLPQRLELDYCTRHFNSIEINGSFYSLQRPDSYASWYEATPRNFVFSLKGSRFVTHMKKLSDVEIPVANFFASGVLRLKEKLGPIVWQFPAQFRFHPEKFETFFRLLPRSQPEAAHLACLHDERLTGRCWTEAAGEWPIRHAVEIRHPSFLVPEFIAMLRRHGIALCFADTAGTFPYTEDVTADFLYLRLHGHAELYASEYTDSALEWWADRIRAWSEGGQPDDARLAAPDSPPPPAAARDVYVYFDNDARGHAPFDAMALGRKLGLPVGL